MTTLIKLIAVLFTLHAGIAAVPGGSYMDIDGRTLSAPRPVPAGTDINIYVRAALATPYQRYVLRYRVESTVRNPVELAPPNYTEIVCSVRAPNAPAPGAE